MRVHVFILFFLVLNGVTVSAWSHVLGIAGVRLDFFMPALAWYALNDRNSPSSVLVVAVTGLFYDLLSGNPMGLYTVTVVLIYALMKYVIVHATMEFWWQRYFLALLSSFVFNAILRTFSGYIETVWPWGALQSVVDALSSLMIFPMFSGVLPVMEKKGDE